MQPRPLRARLTGIRGVSLGLRGVPDPQGGSLGSWASRVGIPVIAEEQERGQGRRGMEGEVRTWGEGPSPGCLGIPSCHRQTSPGTEAEGEAGEGPSGETMRGSCDCGLWSFSHS